MPKKKTRLFHGNQHIGSFYTTGKLPKKYTPYQIFMFKLRRLIYRLFKLSLLSLCLYFIYMAGAYFNSTVIYTKGELIKEEVVIDNLSGKIEELKGEIIKDIQTAESQGAKEEDGLVIFDTNKKASVGTYQFQVATVIHYYKKLYNKDIKGKEALLIALDDNKAGELARDIIFTEPKGWRNWYNSSMKKGVPEKLAIINKLQQ